MNSLVYHLNTKVYRPLLNACSGLALSVFTPFKKGDFIEIDGKIGSVENRGIQTTAIKSPDGELTAIDNSKFYFHPLHNLSSQNIIRLDLSLSVNLDTDMSELKREIVSFLQSKDYILSSPIPKIQVTRIQKQHIDLVIKPWCLLDDFLELDAKLEILLEKHIAKVLTNIKLKDSFKAQNKLITS